jgi:hypothetical protein
VLIREIDIVSYLKLSFFIVFSEVRFDTAMKLCPKGVFEESMSKLAGIEGIVTRKCI